MSRTRPTACAAAGAFVILGALAACGTTVTTEPTSLALDRPIDLAFACFGTVRITGGTGPAQSGEPVVVSAAPIGDCDQFALGYNSTPPPQYGDPNAPPPGQETYLDPATMQPSTPSVSYYAFILQSVPGTLAVSTWVPKQPKDMIAGDVTVLDADPLTPGDNGISIGDQPVGIYTDRSGCYEVTTNAGTCDLSTMDITSALSIPSNPQISRVPVVNPSGTPILAKARTATGEPNAGPIGVMCPATPQGLMYVAYPNCHTVAAIDTSTGTTVAGIHFAADGTVTLGDGNFTCPAECGVADPIVDGVRPTSLSLVDDPRVDGSKLTATHRLAIGLENSNKITVVDLDDSHLPTGTPLQVALSDGPKGAVGVTDVALTPQIGMGGDSGNVSDDTTKGGGPGGQFQFVYAVATDGTVRVVDTLDVKQECDTQIDPRYLTNVTDIHYLSCMPVGDPRNPTRATGLAAPNDKIVAHRTNSVSTGIQLLTDSQPIAVSIVHTVPLTVSGVPPNPDIWMGYFAVITATNGTVYVANVDDDNYPDIYDPTKPLSQWLALALPHQLRDRIQSRDALDELPFNGVDMLVCDDAGSDPDTATDTTELTDGPHLFPINGSPIEVFGSSNELATAKLTVDRDTGAVYYAPSVHQVLCSGADEDLPVPVLSFAAPADVRAQTFPDLMAMRNDETWTIDWEGALSADSPDEHINGLIVRTGQAIVDGTGMRVTEGTHPYCAVGAQPYDTVLLRGCDPTVAGECGNDNTCYVDPRDKTGVGQCLPTSQVDSLAGPCHEFLVSARRYAVTDAKSTELRIIPRRHVLRTTPLDGCTSDAQCGTTDNLTSSLEVAQIQLLDDLDPERYSDPSYHSPITGSELHSWACEADPSRPGPNQCVATCPNGTDDECQKNTTDDLGAVCDPDSHRCVEAVVPPLQCVTTLQRYEIDAGRAFTVIGTQSGYIHPIVADANDECVVNPAANPVQIGRIPLTAPPCVGDGLTDLSPNPCETTVTQEEWENNYAIASATQCVRASPPTVMVSRQATAIRFRSPMMTFDMVDPVYPGDKYCLGDRQGTSNLPVVFQGYTLEVRIVSGFLPYLLQLANTVYPIGAKRGPYDSIWVTDEGDFLSPDAASTRGAVYRIESTAPSTINTIQ